MQSWALWDAVLLLLSFHVPAMSLELIELFCFKSIAVNCFHYKEKLSLLCSFCKGPKFQWGTRLSKHGKAWFSKSGKTRPTANLSERQRSVEVIRLPRPPRQTDNLGNLEEKRAEATTTGAGSGKWQKSRHVATIAPLPRLLAIIGRSVVAWDIDLLHSNPQISIFGNYLISRKCENLSPNCLKQENISDFSRTVPLRCKEMLFSNYQPFWSSLTSNDMNFHWPFTRIRHGCQVWSPSDCNNCNIVVPAVTSQVMKGVALSRVAIWNRGGALLPIALHCSALWWQLTLEETWLQLGDEGGEGGCLPSNQTSLVALHWIAIDCIWVQ